MSKKKSKSAMTVNRVPIESPKELEFPKESPKELELPKESPKELELPKESPKESPKELELPKESPKELELLEDPIEVLAKQQNISYNTAKTVIETRKALEEAKIRSNEMAKKYEEISNALALQLDTEHKRAIKALEEARIYSEECSKALELLRRKSNPIM